MFVVDFVPQHDPRDLGALRRAGGGFPMRRRDILHPADVHHVVDVIELVDVVGGDVKHALVSDRGFHAQRS